LTDCYIHAQRVTDVCCPASDE